MTMTRRLLGLCVLWAFISAGHALPQDEVLFRRTLPDGTQLYVTRRVVKELRTRLQAENPSLTSRELFVNHEHIEETYTLYGLKQGMSQPGVLWEKGISFSATGNAIGADAFKFLDAHVADNALYVLYRHLGSVTIESLEAIDIKKWRNYGWSVKSSSDIRSLGDFTAIFSAAFLTGSKPQFYLEIRSFDGQTRKEVWKFDGRYWKRTGKYVK